MMVNSRNKGARGERLFSNAMFELTGIESQRNLEQSRNGGHDLVGLPFAVEVKHYSTLTRSQIVGFWQQALVQSQECGLPPALAYKENRKPWKVRIPIALLYQGAWESQCEECGEFHPPDWMDSFEYSIELELEGFAYICREIVGMDAELERMTKQMRTH